MDEKIQLKTKIEYQIRFYQECHQMVNYNQITHLIRKIEQFQVITVPQSESLIIWMNQRKRMPGTRQRPRQIQGKDLVLVRIRVNRLTQDLHLRKRKKYQRSTITLIQF